MGHNWDLVSHRSCLLRERQASPVHGFGGTFRLTGVIVRNRALDAAIKIKANCARSAQRHLIHPPSNKTAQSQRSIPLGKVGELFTQLAGCACSSLAVWSSA
jgi:hypothetical protein